MTGYDEPADTPGRRTTSHVQPGDEGSASDESHPALEVSAADDEPASNWGFPDPRDAPGDLVAAGGDLDPGTLLAAYRAGLFPMPAPSRLRRGRISWFSPDPRAVIPLDGLKVSRSLRRSLRRYAVTRDGRFSDVMRACADPSRHGAWIDEDFITAYTRLHQLGWAHSFETLDEGGRLVGGLYGVRIARFFAGEAMFHLETDASKVALVHLVEWLRTEDVALLDVQWLTPHLASLGAIETSRADYLDQLAVAVGAELDGLR